MSQDQFKQVLHEALAEQSAQFDAKLTQQVDTLEQRLDAKLDAKLTEQSTQFDTKLAQQATQFDAKFAELKGEFAKVRRETDAISEGLFKLYQHVEERFDKLETRLDRTDARFDQVMTVLDSLSKAKETDEQERTIMNHQLDRHKGWITQLANHTNTKLVPEQ